MKAQVGIEARRCIPVRTVVANCTLESLSSIDSTKLQLVVTPGGDLLTSLYVDRRGWG